MFRVLENIKVAEKHYMLSLEAAEVAAVASPGQFLHLRCPECPEPLLRRPISIHRCDREKGSVKLFFRVLGRGTALLARKRAGELVDVMGPLGRGFSLPDRGEKVLLIAGGMGVAPLFSLAREVKLSSDVEVTLYLGAPGAEQLFCLDEIAALGIRLLTATDDGSAGFKGTVLGLLRREAHSYSPDRVYACGPPAMLKGLAEYLRQNNINGQFSLEERMACGVGACLSCACKTKTPGGEIVNSHVCTDGPVFNVQDIVW